MVPAMNEMQGAWKSCPHCAAQMPETAGFCPGCGRPMRTAPAQGRIGALPQNLAGALAYLSPVPAIILLLIEPYRRSHFVRFHSFQCLLLCGAAVALAAALRLAGLVLFLIPVLGPLLVTLIDVIAGLAAMLLWLVLLIKALQGEMFRFPLLCAFAEQYAGLV